MEKLVSLSISNVQSSEDMAELIDIASRVIKPDTPLDHKFHAEDKKVIFPSVPETDALNIDFLLNRMKDQGELKNYDIHIGEVMPVEAEEEFQLYADVSPDEH